MDILEKREWIYGSKASKEELFALGASFFKDKLVHDACDCFVKAGEYNETVKQIQEFVVQEGDFFLGQKLQSLTKFSPEQWNTLAQNAENKGKYTFAYSAYTQANNPNKAKDAIKNNFPS